MRNPVTNILKAPWHKLWRISKEKVEMEGFPKLESRKIDKDDIYLT